MVSQIRSDEPEYKAWLALDWADQKHVWALQPSGRQERERGEVEHTPEAVEAWMQGLLQRFGGGPIAVCLEQARGALVYMLMKYQGLVLYPAHPATVGLFRAALYPSGAKDDPQDADLLLDLLLQHRSHLRAWKPDTVETRTLQLLVQQRRQWVDQRTAHSNQLTQVLKQYFPQVLGWFGEVSSPLVQAFLERWPTLEAAQTARPQTLRDFFHAHNCRGEPVIERRIAALGKAVPATRDQAILRSSQLQVEGLLPLLAVLRQNLAQLDREIATAARQHPDFAVFDSFPGAGPVLAPRLLAAFGTQRERFAAAGDLQSFSGIAPVTERSGKLLWVHFRYACPKFLRQTFQEWAGHSIAFCGWARAYYQQQTEKGADHHAAVRSLAAKWIRIAFRCWQTGTPYHEQTYLDSLRRHGSPLATRLGLTTAKP